MKNRKQDYSVLMSVYQREDPRFLRESMTSVFEQTAPTNDFVLVCDGELTDGLNEVIAEMSGRYDGVLNVVRLSENVGLGRALGEGLKHCKNELIARMDSDDIAYPDRCERQLTVFEKGGVDIVSGTVEEFEGSTDNILARRVLPETQAEILAFAKKRSPFNHPCVMYRKSAVEAVGGYQDIYLLEDYYLWVRMLMNGSVGYNIQEPILYMRAGDGMYKRRSGVKYARAQRKLFGFMRKNGFISFGEYLSMCIVRTCSSLAPNMLRKKMYKIALRK